jgi:hypothetical protein
MAGAIDKESKMKFIVCAATAVFLLWGTPALAGPCADLDGDGVCDVDDNCINGGPKPGANPAQDDTDGDLCGNVCDPNRAQNGTVGFPDILGAINSFNTVDMNKKTREPIGNVVGFPDILDSINYFNMPPGPSGKSVGAASCP